MDQNVCRSNGLGLKLNLKFLCVICIYQDKKQLKNLLKKFDSIANHQSFSDYIYTTNSSDSLENDRKQT